MEKEKYQELSPEEVKKFEEENMTDTEREMSERRVKDILNKTKTRALSDAELIQKGAKPVLDEGTEDLRLEISKKALRGVKKEMSENLSPKDRPRILEVIKKLGIKGNRWISDEEFIKKIELKQNRSLGAWEELYKGEKHYVMGDIIKIRCKNGKVFKGRLIEELNDDDYNRDESEFILQDDRIEVYLYGVEHGGDEEEVLFNDIEDISIVKKEE